MAEKDGEAEELRSAALRNAQSILLARRRAEEAFRKQSEWLRITLSSIGDAVICTDSDGGVMFMNGVAESLTGWPQADAIGRPLPEIFQIVNERTRQPVENSALRAMREGVVVRLANHPALIARDGTERAIDDSAAPIRDDSGVPVGAGLVFRDFTESRQAEGTRARLAAIVESSEDAIVSKTLDGVILSWNAGAERLFGYTPDEAIGRPITLIIPADRQDEEHAILARISGGERVEHFETVRVSKQGRRVDISLTVSPVRDGAGRVVGSSKIARDITEQKRTREALKEADRQKDEFLALLARANLSLEKQAAELERSNLELREFAFIASHDLQAPLRAIGGFVQLLRDTYPGRLDEQADAWIAHTVAGVERMQALIRDLLAYSQIESRGRPFEATDSREVFHQVIEGLDASIRDANAQVTCGELPTVASDRSQLLQLLQNLIGNAIKYRGDQPPRVHVSAEKQRSEWVFSVSDNGIGINPKHYGRIFEIFRRLHTQQAYPGTGIGLAICRRVVQRHGGRIWVESEPGRGSTFVFTLPERSTP